MSRLFWLDDAAWSAIEPLLPKSQPGAKPVIPGRSNRTKPIRHDKRCYKERWRIEATIGRLKECRRVATRYDKLARICLDAVTIASIYPFGL